MNISERAMLVKLSITGYSPSKKDKKATAEVEHAHQTRAGMAKVSKYTIHPDALKPIGAVEASTRQAHYERTLPWCDDGARILSAKAYMAYADLMRNSERQWTAAVDEFCQNWDDHVQNARQALNGLFDPKDYPTKDEVRRRFKFEWKVLPVPAGEDFRVDLGADEVAVIKAGIEAQAQATLQEATREVWRRLAEVVGKMSERLHAYAADKSPFRDSLVENIRDLLSIVPSLNLADDPTITQFCDEIRQKLCKHPDALRQDYFIRNDTMRAADEILAKMQGYLA